MRNSRAILFPTTVALLAAGFWWSGRAHSTGESEGGPAGPATPLRTELGLDDPERAPSEFVGPDRMGARVVATASTLTGGIRPGMGRLVVEITGGPRDAVASRFGQSEFRLRAVRNDASGDGSIANAVVSHPQAEVL